jgi:hypothetical protein
MRGWNASCLARPTSRGAGGALNLLQFPTLNHRCAITSGVRLDECRQLLKSFFQEQRAAGKAAPPNSLMTPDSV